MLMPSSYDVEWTGLQEVFNDYPPPPPPIPAAAAATVGAVAAASNPPNGRHSVTVPISAGQSSTSAVLPANAKRRSLIIQNNSTATTAGDVAPTFYFNFNTQAVIGLSIALPPGNQGIVLDENVSSDSLYITIGPEVNTGGSVVVQGCVVETAEGPAQQIGGGNIPAYWGFLGSNIQYGG